MNPPEIIQTIAHGGISDIYLARSQDRCVSSQFVVIKSLKKDLDHDDEAIALLKNEFEISKILKHPNILEIYDFGEYDERPCLWMEYMDAQDLRTLFKTCADKNEKIPVGIALYIISQIAEALHATHELVNDRMSHLVHRDVTPENILFNQKGDIKLADFGIAVPEHKTIENPDIINGKFNYLSPEQAWGDLPDRRSDIFSLAICLYETLLGQSFYPNNNSDETLACARIALFLAPHEINPDFPEFLERILLKALDLDKNMRYPTARDFAEELSLCAHSLGCSTTKDDWITWLKARIPA